MTPVEQAAYNLGFARGSGDEGAYQREITRLRDCWAEALANYAKQNSEIDQLRSTLSLAEEGLANYEEENQAAVALIRALVAYGHEPLPADLVQRAGLFLERYPYEQQVPQSPVTNDSGNAR